MKKKYYKHLLNCIFITAFLFFIYPSKNNMINAKTSNENISGSQNKQNNFVALSNDDMFNTEPLVFENFILINGLEIVDVNRRRFVQLAPGSKKGRAEINFFDNTAMYDLQVFYVDESNGRSVINIFINNKKIGDIKLDLYKSDLKASSYSSSYREKTFNKINIQKWSKISIDFSGDGDERCRIEKLILTPAGNFEGFPVNLSKPLSLSLFETYAEQRQGRNIFSDYVQEKIDSLAEKRKAELAKLRTPADWKARQLETRKQLHKFFGEFPEKTPLNAKTVDKLERTNYTIEKIIFESQPKFYVTANLYIPKNRALPLPGVVFPCGHSDDAKAQDFYHMTGLGFALKGYVVLIFDPIGQGERSEYYDAGTGQNLINKGVDQHHYVGKPAFLADWSLSGIRTWDAIRAVDYLVSRPEVDSTRLAAAGCSGGGQMALLITAVDERIKVCAASHPGGSMENTYLPGRDLIDREILSLIPPRPLRIIVGNASGEEPGHRIKLEDMHLFYEGLRAGKQSGEIDVVPGVHSMNRSNRESAYEWVNKWMDKEAEGKAEPFLEPEEIETLWCTESGNTIHSLGGETGQTLISKRADLIYRPETDLNRLKERISLRTGFSLSENEGALNLKSLDIVAIDNYSVEKLIYESTSGIIIPSLLIKSENIKPENPVYIFASDKGKPNSINSSSLPFLLAKNGFPVLALDVRGTGETSPTSPIGYTQFTGYNPTLWRHDLPAFQSAGFGQTTLGMRTFDIIKGIDFIKSRNDLSKRKIIVIGEGLGGLWALMAAGFDNRIDGVVTVGTLPSYKLILRSKFYNVWGYFFVPGALKDFDIPDLSRLVTPKPQLWIDPVNAMGKKADTQTITTYIQKLPNLQIINSDEKTEAELIKLFRKLFN